MSENKQMKKDMPSLNSSMNMLDIEMELNRFSGDPTYQPLITMAKYLRTGQEEGMRQSTDSWRIFACEKKCIDGRLLVKYQHSITTQHFMKAIEEYETGSNLLQNYKKKSVDTEGDCDYLKPAFENYVNGHMHENSFFGNFISKDTYNLVKQYLKLKPDDFMVEYLKVLFGLTYSPSDHEKSLLSDYEGNKLVIRTGELFAHKLKSSKIRTSERKKVLSELYYYLGSRYVASCQIERALNSFQKSFDHERSNYCALYGIAYCYMKSEPEKAKTLFYQYLEMAPSCDKKFPNAYYMLATLFVETNIDEALRYCALAEKAENERLPFLQPVIIPEKKMMQTLKAFKSQLGKCMKE
jgi:tetratricopeptide (TPR) repeat protein